MKPILDSQICQIESDYKQYFSKMHTFKLFINQKIIILSFPIMLFIKKRAIGTFLQPNQLVIQQ